MRSRLALLIVTTATLLAASGPAVAQSAGTGGSGQSTSHAGGSSASGGSASTASVSTSGGSNVGVVQGNVAEGSTASGSSNAGAAQGDQTGGSSTAPAAADAPSAVQDGIVSQLDLPAIGTADDAVPATQPRPDVVTWAMVAALAAGLAVVYRRLPRPTRA